MDGPHNEALDIIIFIMQLGHPILGTGRMTLKEYASEKNHGGLIKYLAMFFLNLSLNGSFHCPIDFLNYYHPFSNYATFFYIVPNVRCRI